MATTFEQGSWVWLPDAQHCAVPAQVKASFIAGQQGYVITADGEDRLLTVEETKTVSTLHAEALDVNVDNMINFHDLSENALLHNLRIRFQRDHIYTYISSILISVNPFKQLPLYTPDVIEKYRTYSHDKPPHVFATADTAYKAMLAERKSQSIVISGESGAGKSEATKLILQYLVDISRAQGRFDGLVTPSGLITLEQKILQSNPLMEAFGNAKTVRNNNSSRFGKLITVYFDQVGAIIGGSVISYLLEKSRVVNQMSNERNYHIFYQLIRGVEAHPELKEMLKLDVPSTFAYLNQSGVDNIEGVSDENDFNEVKQAMTALNITQDEQLCIFKCVAAILHFGNINFEPEPVPGGDDGSRVSNFAQLHLACYLLGVDSEAMKMALTWRNIGTRSITLVPYSVIQAQQARDAMTKAVYAALFEWLMRKINQALSSGNNSLATTSQNVIGVLDIFGFESFETNSFEQLCINFCNEKLQFHFNEHIFRLEQELYASEGISVPATAFKDNRSTLLLLEDKTTGLFSMIDEEGNVPKGSDEGYLNKVKNKHGKHENIVLPKPNQKIKDAAKCFGVRHYAGDVFYNVSSFIDKNKDTLHGDILAVLQASDSIFLQEVLASSSRGNDAGVISPVRRGAADTAFSPTSNAGLRAEISSPIPATVGNKLSPTGGRKTSTNAVRPPAAPGSTPSNAATGTGKKLTLSSQFKCQLTQLMETLYSTCPHFVRCMKPNLLKQSGIFESHMMLAQLRYAGLLEVCRIRKLGFPVRKDFGDFYKRYNCMGGNKPSLSELTNQLVAKGALVEGGWAMGRTMVFLKTEQQKQLEVKREEALLAFVRNIQKHCRRYTVQRHVKRWKENLAGLQIALSLRSLLQLENGLEMSTELPHGGHHLKIVQQAVELRQRLLEEQRVTSLLQAAIAARELMQLQAALAVVNGMIPPFTSPLFQAAIALVQRLEEESRVRSELMVAVKKPQKVQLEDLLGRAEVLGLQDETVVRQARRVLERLQQEEEVLQHLKNAAEQRDLIELRMWLAKTVELGMQGTQVESANKMEKVLETELLVKADISMAVKTRDLSTLRGLLAKAEEVGLTPDDERIAEAQALVDQLHREFRAVETLFAAMQTRQIASVRSALEQAQAFEHVARSPEYALAAKCLETLLAEEACRAAMVASKGSKDSQHLMQVLGEALRLGLSGPDVDAVRTALQKVGMHSSLRRKMQEAVQSTDFTALDGLLQRAGQEGLGETPEVQFLQDRRKALLLLEEIRHAVEVKDCDKITTLLATAASIPGLASEFSEQLSEAKAAREKLDDTTRVTKQLQLAMQAREVVPLQKILDQIKTAKSDGISNELIYNAASILLELRRAEACLVEVAEASRSQQADRLEAAILSARRCGVPEDKLQTAWSHLERLQQLDHAREELQAAMSQLHLKHLQDCLERALQVGLEGPEVVEACALRDEWVRLGAVRLILSNMVADVQKAAEQGADIQEADVAELEEGIKRAQSEGLSDRDVEMRDAVRVKARLTQQLMIQSNLLAALKTKKQADLKRAIDAAKDAGLYYLESLVQAQALIKMPASPRATGAGEYTFRESLRRNSEQNAAEAAGEQVSIEALRARARDRRYKFNAYPGLRTPDDFAKGILLAKKKTKDDMLVWQNTVINRSLTQLDSELGKIALQLHRCLLGYMGDKQMSFPATLAQEILKRGHEVPELRDEIYLQVLKQISGNKQPESLAKGWQILCMCVGTFPPTDPFQEYLFNFILERETTKGAVQNYARYSLKTLENILRDGPPAFIPTVAEISAYKERPPILATIETVNGALILEEYTVTPDLNIHKLVVICAHALGLKGTAWKGPGGVCQFGMFVHDLPGDPPFAGGRGSDATRLSPTAEIDLPTGARPLADEDFLGTVLVEKARRRCNYKFVFKRKVFLSRELYSDNYEDAIFQELTYLQLEDDALVTGNLLITSETDALTLATLALLVNYGQGYSQTEYLLDFIPPACRSLHNRWDRLVIERAQQPLPMSLATHTSRNTPLLQLAASSLRQAFINHLSSHPLYGAHHFHVEKHNSSSGRISRLPKDLMLALNCTGLHILDRSSWRILLSYAYPDLYKWGGSTSQFSVVLWDSEKQATFDLTVITEQAIDIATIIMDYVHAIMAVQPQAAGAQH